MQPLGLVVQTELVNDRSAQVAYEQLLPRARSIRDAVVNSLLILKPEGAFIGPDWVSSPNPFYFGEPRWSFPTRPNLQSEIAAELTDEEADTVRGLVEIRSNATLDGQLALALRRLQDASIRTVESDKLIDYWIGLEALFGQTHQELRYRVSFRLARFLGTEQAERKAIRNAAYKSYALRSKVVHGSSVEGQLAPRLNEAGAWLRDSVRLSLLNEAVPPDRDALDDLALA